MIDEKVLLEAMEEEYGKISKKFVDKGLGLSSELDIIANTFMIIDSLINRQPKVGEWIPCSGCADCTHKECEHYGSI